MRKLLLSGLLLAIFLTGCARNYYNVPTENLADKVKTLGIAPIFVDTESDISYPQKDLLIQLITDFNRRYEPQLARKLKTTGNFYTVALLDNEPGSLFTALVSRRENRDDAGIRYNKYFWNNEELRNYIRKNNLDAVMLLTVSGLTKNEKIFSSNMLTSLTANYNYLTLTAQILDVNGTVLWEYPNFRRRILSYSPLINLQYPDFSESEANLSQKTEVKFKTLDGIRRALEKKRKDWLLRETTEPEAYGNQFDEIVSLVKYDPDKNTTSTSTSAEAARQGASEAYKPVAVQPVPMAAPSAPASKLSDPPVEPDQQSVIPATSGDISAADSDEIVPATGSTR